MTDTLTYNQRYYLAHKEKMKESSRQYYQHCRMAGNICPSDNLHKLQQREVEHLRKLKILAHYSNPPGIPICNNCSEQDIEVLCIDHINGGGRKQLQETKSKGSGFYRWLTRHGFPKGYQVLCANCNMRKSKYEQVVTRKKNYCENGNFVQ